MWRFTSKTKIESAKQNDNFKQSMLGDGMVANLKLVVSATSNNLSAYLKTFAGANPSASDLAVARINGNTYDVDYTLGGVITKFNYWDGTSQTYKLYVYLIYCTSNGKIDTFFSRKWDYLSWPSSPPSTDNFAGLTGFGQGSLTAGDPMICVGSFDVTQDASDNFTAVANVETTPYNMPPAVFFQGALGAELSGNKTITTEAVVGMICNGSTIIPTVAGYYHIHAQQLISTGASAIYLYANKNGANQKWGYQGGSMATKDIMVDLIAWFNGTTDYISFSFGSGPASTVWTGGHSSVCIHKIN